MPRIPSSDRRALLVQAAIRVIAKHGVAGATTRAIVGEAGMSLASFHYAFRSHSEMMREVVAYVVGAEVASAFATLRLGSSIRQVVREGLQSYLDYVIADPGHEQVMQELVHYALRTPGLEGLAAEQYEAYHSGVTSVLLEGAAVSGVEWTVPVDDVARLVVTITDGVTLAWLANRDAAAAERVLDFAADSLAALATPIRTRENAQ
ncbi:hypothetical protein BH11ACT5_BH11ACT5_10640 [soil metagenome]